MKSLTTSILLLGLLMGCATIGSLGTAANQLDDESRRFYEQLHAEQGTANADSEAMALADAARDFNRAVDDNMSRDNLRQVFSRVSERYHRLRNRLDDSNYRDSYQRAGFDRVTQAYLDVDRSLNHP
jgi:hypothetical protein